MCGRIVTRNTGSNFLFLLMHLSEQLADTLGRRFVYFSINIYRDAD